MIINQRIDTFLGLNNMLNPSSAEYREGMAYRSKNSRIDESGLWSTQQRLVTVGNPPSLIASPSGGGLYLKSLNVDGVEKIVSMAVGTSCDVGPNRKLYSTTGADLKNADGDITAFTPPTVPTAELDNTASSRALDGTYYYMCTFYDPTYQRESLPSPVASVELDTSDTNTNIKVTAPNPPAGCTVRIYRSKRTSATDEEYNPANVFYFLAETSGGVYYDYLHDTEIENAEYEGRGTDPITAIGGYPEYLVSFNSRLLYFKNGMLYWSSSGRPQEVAKNYTVSIGGVNVTCKPKLSTGTYGEAKYEIVELKGHKVKAAYALGNRLWVWTDSAMGYIEATNRFEGFRFNLMYEGVGVTSDKVLSLSPYGLFGADYSGIWLFRGTSRPERLTDKRINLWSGQDTTYTYENFTNSFGCYVPVLNEYWWGISGKILAYQADRDIFVGPYGYNLSSGCIIPAAQQQNYFSGGVSPSPSEKLASDQYLEFWFGQSTPTTIKDQVIAEVLHSQVPAGTVTLNLYQNSVTSKTGAASPAAVAYTTSAGKILGVSSGRFFLLDIYMPSIIAPIAVINYKYNPAGDTLGG